MILTADEVEAREFTALFPHTPPACEGNHADKSAHDSEQARWLFNPGCTTCPPRMVCEGWRVYFTSRYARNRSEFPGGFSCSCKEVVPWDVPTFIPLPGQ